MNISCISKKEKIEIPNYNGKGNLIPIGGGKDSNVTLEILKKSYNINDTYIINPKEVQLECSKIAGYREDDVFNIKRVLDRKIIDLNNQGFLN